MKPVFAIISFFLLALLHGIPSQAAVNSVKSSQVMVAKKHINDVHATVPSDGCINHQPVVRGKVSGAAGYIPGNNDFTISCEGISNYEQTFSSSSNSKAVTRLYILHCVYLL